MPDLQRDSLDVASHISENRLNCPPQAKDKQEKEKEGENSERKEDKSERKEEKSEKKEEKIEKKEKKISTPEAQGREEMWREDVKVTKLDKLVNKWIYGQ